METAQNAPLWIQEIMSGGHHHHTPETEEYGIKSFIFRADRPFHPERFMQFAQDDWDGVVRSKGIFWLATRPNWAMSWSQAGGNVQISTAGRWLSSFSANEIALMEDEIQEEWNHFKDLPFGDRRQEIVIITIKDTQQIIENRLKKCLLSDEEMQKIDEWKDFTDKFPQ